MEGETSAGFVRGAWSMEARSSRRRTWWALLLPVCLLAGCALVPGSRGLMSPQGNRLLHSTQQLCQPIPPGLPRELDKEPLPRYTVEPGDVLLVQPANLDSPLRLP